MSRDKRLVRGCESIVTQQLVSPSSVKYRRSIVGHGETAMRARYYLQKAEDISNTPGYDDAELRSLIKSVQQTKGDHKGEVAVSFDSMNRMGVMLRGLAICTYETDVHDTDAEVRSLGVTFIR